MDQFSQFAVNGGEGLSSAPLRPGISSSFNEVLNLKPFRTDGRICVLTPTTIVCQSEGAVNLVLLNLSKYNQKYKDYYGMENVESQFPSHSPSEEPIRPYIIAAHYEIELDDILTFDVCAISWTMVTAHKSGCLRKWDLRTGVPTIVTGKLPYSGPVNIIEINKMNAELARRSKQRSQDKTETCNKNTAKKLKKKSNEHNNSTDSVSKLHKKLYSGKDRDWDEEHLDLEVWSHGKLGQPEPLDKEYQNLQLEQGMMWSVLSGNQITVYRKLGDSYLHSQIQTVGNEIMLTYARWNNTKSRYKEESVEIAISATIIYIMQVSQKNLHCQVTQKLEGHNSSVTGIEWYGDFKTSDGIMISASQDRTFMIWKWNSEGGLYVKQNTLVWNDPIISTSILEEKFLFLFSKSNISFIDLSVHQSTHKLIWHKTDWWNGQESITGVYRSHPFSDQVEELYITSDVGFIHCAKLVDCNESQKRKFEHMAEYQCNFQVISAVKIWQPSSNGVKIVVANNTPIITVYEAGDFVRLIGHKDSVISLATKDEYLLSGSKDKAIIVWQSNNLQPVHILNGHTGPVVSVCFGGTTSIIYSVGGDCSLIKWVDYKLLTRTQAHETEIHAIDSSPNGNLLVTCSKDKTAKLWDSSNLKPTGTLSGHKKAVWDARFSPVDMRIVTSSADTTLKIWNIESLECLTTLQGHSGIVTQGFFTNKGLQVISVSSDGQWRCWELVGSTTVSVNESCSEFGPIAIDSTLSASLVVTGSSLGELKCWTDVTSQARQEKLETQKKKLIDTQNLNNAMTKADWKYVLQEAIKLNRPMAVIRAIRGMGTLPQLRNAIEQLPKESKLKLQSFSKQWQTNHRTKAEGEEVARILIVDSTATRLENVILSGYEERHLNRLQKREEHLSVIEHMAENATSLS